MLALGLHTSMPKPSGLSQGSWGVLVCVAAYRSPAPTAEGWRGGVGMTFTGTAHSRFI